MIIFNDRITQQLVARFVNLAPNRLFVAFDFHFQVLADVDGLDSLVAQMLQGVLDRFALRIDDSSLSTTK